MSSNEIRKVKISWWIDEDLLEEIKKRAEQVGAGYQSFMHKLLRDKVFETETIEDRLKKVEKKLGIKS